MILVLHLVVGCFILLECAVLLDDVLIILLLQGLSLCFISSQLLNLQLTLLVLLEKSRIVITHAGVSFAKPVHLEVALFELIIKIGHEALTVIFVFHILLMSLEILRMLISVMLNVK